MRYLCVHCDHRFEYDGDKKKPRCPECMRVGGVEKIRDEKKSSSKEQPKWLVPGGVALVIAALAGGYFYWAHDAPVTVGDEVPLRPLSRGELEGHARRVGATVPEERLALFEADDALDDLGSSASGSSNTAKAESIVEAIRARASATAYVTWPTSAPRDTPIRTATRAYERMAEDGAREKLYSLEVALVAAAALRSADVDAMIAEIYAFPNDRRPPDASGHFGYFGIAVYDGEAGEGTPKILDPYGGRGTEPEEDDYRVIDDLAVLGAFTNHLAIHTLVSEGEHDAAFELSQEALSMDRRSPSIRSVRGVVLLTSGGAEEALEEFEAAAQLRRDAPRLNNLAGIALAQQDLDRASRQVAAALEIHPDFAGGHATQAAIHLARSEMDAAQSELAEARELDPDLPILPMLWANYYMSTHDLERAADMALEAIERKPHDWQTRLSAAQILRAASNYDEMRRQARAIVEMVPSAQVPQVTELIEQVLGPTALEEPLDDEEWDEEWDEETAGLPDGEFQLGDGSSLLGDGELDLGGAPSLGADLEGGSLLNSEETSTLRLGGGGDLTLDLSE
jgi:tetratricopeptide (TPR) repeat protein